MTTNDALQRTLSVWLREDAEHHVPEHLEETLQRTAVTRQRPAWASLERWLPVNLAIARSAFDRPYLGRALAVLVVIALLIAALIAASIGSPRQPLAPYGLAANGVIVASHDGDIYAIDAATHAQTAIVSGASFDFSPVFSRDGTKFVFLRSDGQPANQPDLTLMVSNANGTGLRALTRPSGDIAWFDWSPNGVDIAYVSDGRLNVVNLDGSAPKTLQVGGPAHFVTWRPPDGSEIIFRREHLTVSDPAPAIFAVRPDGTGLRQLSKTPANNAFDYQGVAVAPDGGRVAFTRWSLDGSPAVYLLDVATGTETRLPAPANVRQTGGVFSPDGKLIAYSRVYPEGAFELVVAPMDGSGLGRALGQRFATSPDGTEVNASYAFTPDGSAVLATYGADETVRLLPVDGSAGSILTSGAFTFTDIQRVAR
jgi:Tol biopolymer transport system component